MDRKYLSKTGRIIKTWYNDLGRVDIMSGDEATKIACCEFNTNVEKPTFEYKGETFYIDDFMCLSIDELIDSVNKALEKGDRFAVRECDMLATIMKHSDKIGFVITEYSGRISDNKMIEIIMKPIERNRKIKDWHYKIELEEINCDTDYIRHRDFYFSDLWSSVMTGHFKLVKL